MNSVLKIKKSWLTNEVVDRALLTEEQKEFFYQIIRERSVKCNYEVNEEVNTSILESKEQITEDDCRLLLVAGILTQVKDDLLINYDKLEKDLKPLIKVRLWNKNHYLPKDKKEMIYKGKHIDLNKYNSLLRDLEELKFAKQDAIDFLNPDSGRLEEFLEHWEIQIEPDFLRKSLMGNFKFKSL